MFVLFSVGVVWCWLLSMKVLNGVIVGVAVRGDVG